MSNLKLSLLHNVFSPHVSLILCWSAERKSLNLYSFPAPFYQVYVLKRPHVDEFLQKMGELYECVLFTASLAKVGPNVNNMLICSNIPCCTHLMFFLGGGVVSFCGTFSMLTLWQICWTSGGYFAPGSSGNPVFSTEETTSKTSADWAGSSVKSSS